jgi:hypothetical protein
MKRVPQPANTPFVSSDIMMCDYNALATKQSRGKGKAAKGILNSKNYG